MKVRVENWKDCWDQKMRAHDFRNLQLKRHDFLGG